MPNAVSAEKKISAEEIMRAFEMPEPEVRTLKSFGSGASGGAPPTFKPRDRPWRETAAALDAHADVAAAGHATMSKPVSHGPTKTVLPDRGAPWEVKPSPQGTYEHAETKPASAPTPTPPTAAPAKTSATRMQAPGLAAPRNPQGPPRPAPATPPRPHVSDAPTPRAGDGPRIGVVQSDFNKSITDRMAAEATKQATKLGASVVQHLHVPGVFDAPLAVQSLLRRRDVDAVVVIGAVIQGETDHDDVITHACAGQLASLACQFDKPVGFGVTGPGMTKAQAEARIGSGRFAVESVIQQWRTLQTVATA